MYRRETVRVLVALLTVAVGPTTLSWPTGRFAVRCQC